MKGQARLIKEQDDRHFVVLHLGELNQEREEPDESGTALRERHIDAMNAVVDARSRDRSLVERRTVPGLCRSNRYLDRKKGVLGPVLENLVGDRVGRGLKSGIEGLIGVGGEDFVERS